MSLLGGLALFILSGVFGLLVGIFWLKQIPLIRRRRLDSPNLLWIYLGFPITVTVVCVTSPGYWLIVLVAGIAALNIIWLILTRRTAAKLTARAEAERRTPPKTIRSKSSLPSQPASPSPPQPLPGASAAQAGSRPLAGAAGLDDNAVLQLKDDTLVKANLAGQNLSDKSFDGMDMSGANLEGCVLVGTQFSGTILREANSYLFSGDRAGPSPRRGVCADGAVVPRTRSLAVVADGRSV